MNKSNQYKFNNKQAKSYVIGFGTFLLLFISILVSPFVFGKTYAYTESIENEYQTINNTIKMAVVNKEYNPEERLFRIDISVEESAENTALPNIQYEVESRYIENQKKKLETEIKKINDNYFILFIKDVPEKYEVLSTTIVPSYVHSSLQTTNDLENKSFKIYINQTEKLNNYKLKIEEGTYYEKEYISFIQNEIKQKILESESEIETNNLAITEIKSLIKDLEKDIEYQTEEEKFETTNKINKHKTTINKHETKIKEIEITIDEYNNRINKLEEKKESL